MKISAFNGQARLRKYQPLTDKLGCENISFYQDEVSILFGHGD
jgi:hypothetical protein